MESKKLYPRGRYVWTRFFVWQILSKCELFFGAVTCTKVLLDVHNYENMGMKWGPRVWYIVVECMTMVNNLNLHLNNVMKEHLQQFSPISIHVLKDSDFKCSSTPHPFYEKTWTLYTKRLLYSHLLDQSLRSTN